MASWRARSTARTEKAGIWRQPRRTRKASWDIVTEKWEDASRSFTVEPALRYGKTSTSSVLYYKTLYFIVLSTFIYMLMNLDIYVCLDSLTYI
uniref:Uncharacterized protein n=1 Tax=Oryza barthii TaxID=65489 RepID=A0A0D3GF34_9ORYZ